MCTTFAKGVQSNGKQFLRIVCVYQQPNELYEQQQREGKKSNEFTKNYKRIMVFKIITKYNDASPVTFVMNWLLHFVRIKFV